MKTSTVLNTICKKRFCKLPISLRKISRVFWEKIGLLIIFIQRTSIFYSFLIPHKSL